MGEYFIQPGTGSAATYTTSGTHVALDVNLIQSGLQVGLGVGSVREVTRTFNTTTDSTDTPFGTIGLAGPTKGLTIIPYDNAGNPLLVRRTENDTMDVEAKSVVLAQNMAFDGTYWHRVRNDSGTNIGDGAMRVSVVPAPYSGGDIPVVGSVYTLSSPGSIPTWQTIPLFDLGSPGFKQLIKIASGTCDNVWVPGVGSKLEIHGWNVSSQAAMIIRVLISGANITELDNLYLPNSGTAFKTFVHPITPGITNETLGFGRTAAGSVNITFYGREKV